MSTNWKKVRIWVSIAVVVFIIGLFVGGYFAFQYLISPMLSTPRLAMPEGLNKTGVSTGKEFLSKSVYVEDSRLGTISDIAFGKFSPKPAASIAIAGNRGALLLDDNAKAKAYVKFSVRAGHTVIVDVDKDGSPEYLNRGGGWQKVSLHDNSGNTVWTVGGMPAVNDIAAGDINRDGILEFVVGYNGGGGVRLLDRNAKEIWKQSGSNVWHVEFVDLNSDGNLKIMHSNAAGEMTIRDKDGEIISKSKPEPYFSHFSLCRWPNKSAQQFALLAYNNNIWVLDFSGKTAARLDTTIPVSYGHARGVPVKFKSDHPEYFAVLVDFHTWKKSVLYVYGADKKPVYQEIIPEACASIAALSGNMKDQDSLLVGCEGKVLKYSVIN
jgi:hypothetical protein